ncbi:hypothetical protein [Salibacterium aidingense]|uniref:hypothetical protein n=1 Tax=Salibacterium aidingense TaxID=384933 RepID=UPI00047D533A|nr:hypothetical protein [Salibacterium aidingense]
MEKIAHVVSIADEHGNEQVEQFRKDLISEAKHSSAGYVKLLFLERALIYTQSIKKVQLDKHETTLAISHNGKETAKRSHYTKNFVNNRFTSCVSTFRNTIHGFAPHSSRYITIINFTTALSKPLVTTQI